MRDTPSVDPVRVHIALWTGLEDTQVTFLVAGVCFFLFVVVGWCVRHCVAPAAFSSVVLGIEYNAAIVVIQCHGTRTD